MPLPEEVQDFGTGNPRDAEWSALSAQIQDVLNKKLKDASRFLSRQSRPGRMVPHTVRYRDVLHVRAPKYPSLKITLSRGRIGTRQAVLG